MVSCNSGLVTGYQSIDLVPAIQDSGDFSILDLDDLIGVFTHPQIVRNHNPGFPIFVNQLRIGLGHLKGSLSIQAGSWLIS